MLRQETKTNDQISVSVLKAKIRESWLKMKNLRRDKQITCGSYSKNGLKGIGNMRELGHDGISIQVWKHIGYKRVIKLTKLFNNILKSNRMPDKWRRVY